MSKPTTNTDSEVHAASTTSESGVINDADGNDISGSESQESTGGGDTESYEPFWWKSFRFLLLEFEVLEAPLQLLAFETKQTNYPLPLKASVDAAGEPEVKAFFDISVRTLRNCIWDGYSDCPHYEQLQYPEDSRSSMLFHYHISGDDALARQAMTAFAASALPDGMIVGRYPAHVGFVISGFPMFYAFSICDHMQHYADQAFARQHLAVIDGILNFFDRHIGPKGLIERLPPSYWSFVDWHPTWKGKDNKNYGIPPSGDDSSCWTFTTMMYALTLRRMSTLLSQLGRPAVAAEYLARADSANDALRHHCFDGLFFTDSPVTHLSESAHSQHCQVLAVLCGASTNRVEQRRLLEATLADSHETFKMGNGLEPHFAQCSFVLQHYVLRALAQTGLYDKYYHQMWDPWRRMLALNVTTWVEDEVDGRSDCHAWSSVPIYEYTSEVAGLKPRLPGWAAISFAPRVRLYGSYDCTVAIGRDDTARVRWFTEPRGRIQVFLKLSRPFDVVSELEGIEETYSQISDLEISI